MAKSLTKTLSLRRLVVVILLSKPTTPWKMDKAISLPLPKTLEKNTVLHQARNQGNNSRLTNYQCLYLQGSRANCDIQVVTDYHASGKKYASTAEPCSLVIKTTFNYIIDHCNNTVHGARDAKGNMEASMHAK